MRESRGPKVTITGSVVLRAFLEVWDWHTLRPPATGGEFARPRGGNYYCGMWLPDSASPVYNNPIIEQARELVGEDGCMTIAGTNLASFR